MKILLLLCFCILNPALAALPQDGKKEISLPINKDVQRKQKVKQRRQLEAEYKQRMMQLKPDTRQKSLEPQTKQGAASGVDLERLRRQAREEAAIAEQISREYNALQIFPRKAFVGARAKQTSVAMWADSWAQKIERTSTHAYPVDANGNKLRGNLRVTVEINKDGGLLKAEVDRTSGNPELDKAALRIARLAAPFARLPADLLDDAGKPATVLVITRIWFFGPDDQMLSQPENSQGPENAHPRH